MSFHTSYHDSDADDEYTSPHLATDSDASPTDSEPPSEEHTPTSFANNASAAGDARLPETIITEWTAPECAKFLSFLGLRQYCETFLGGFFACSSRTALGGEVTNCGSVL